MTYLASVSEWSGFHVVYKGDMIVWVPVFCIDYQIKRNSIYKRVDDRYHLGAVLTRRTILEIQGTSNKIILDVDYNQRCDGFQGLKIK